LNLSLDDYQNIELGEFFNKMMGFFDHKKETEKREWERSNYLVYSIMMNNPYIKENKKPKSFADFLKGNKKPTIKNTNQLKQFIDFE